MPEPGERVGPYELMQLIAKGGMGTVFRAHDTRLDRDVALKILSPQLSTDDSFRARFEREARIAAHFRHPNIVPVFDAGTWRDQLYLAMMLVDGPSLATVIAREAPLPLLRVSSIIGQVAGALDAAHSQGVIHRDIKPGNVLLLEDAGSGGADHAYLTDFGLTRSASAMTEMTHTGTFLGTVSYIAPEQIQGAVVDGRADQYALACTAYEMLTKGPPFARDTEVAVISAHLYEPPPRLLSVRPDLPPAVSAVIAKAMAKNPADRYTTSGEFGKALAAAATGTVQQPTIGGAVVRQPSVQYPAMPVAVASPSAGSRASSGLIALTVLLAIAVVGTGGALALNLLNASPTQSPVSTNAPVSTQSAVATQTGGATQATPVVSIPPTAPPISPAPTTPIEPVAAPSLPDGSWVISFAAAPPLADHPFKSPDSRQYTNLQLTCSTGSQCIFTSPVFDGGSEVGNITYRWDGQAFVASAPLINVGERCQASVGVIENAYDTRQEIRLQPEPAGVTYVEHLVGEKTIYGDLTPSGASAGCAAYSARFSADMAYVGAAVIPTPPPTSQPEPGALFQTYPVMDLVNIAKGGAPAEWAADSAFQPAVEWFIWDSADNESLSSATFLLSIDGQPQPTQFVYNNQALLVEHTQHSITQVKVIYATLPGLPAGPHIITGTWVGFGDSTAFGPLTVEFR